MTVIFLIIGCVLGFAGGFLVSRHIHARIVKDWLVGRLNVVWDKEEHQPYMFMELANPDVTDITKRKYITLQVNDEIKFTQK